jgi:hypothetical protein
MKKSARIYRKGGTKNVASQPRTVSSQAATEPAPSEFWIPSKVVKDAQAAILEMERVGNAAVAFVMMNAFRIKCGSAGFEEMAVAGFDQGALEYARMVSHDYQQIFKDCSTLASILIEQVRAISSPVKINHSILYTALEPIDPKRCWHRMSSISGALRNCVDLLSWAFSEIGGEPQSGFFEMERNFVRANQDFERSILNLVELFCTVSSKK